MDGANLVDSSDEESEPVAPESDNLVPCPFCCKMFKGIRGLERHEKFCDVAKNLD